MGGVAEEPQQPLRRVVSVELPDPDSANHLAQQLTRRFPSGVMKQDGYWNVGLYSASEDRRFLVEALGAIEAWLRRQGPAAVQVRVGERSYLLEREPV